MTIDTLFLQNVDYPAKLVRQLIASQYDEGVLDLTAFKVTQRGAGANRSVDVSVGQAYVAGDDQTAQGAYLVSSAAIVNVPLDPYPVSNSRYDLIIVQVQDPNATGPAGDNTIVTKVTGTASVSPVIPALPASALLVAIVGPLTSATASVTNSLIHDAQTGTGPTGVTGAHLLAGQRAMPGESRVWRGAAGTVPNGWLLEDGSSQLRSALPRLFATIGTTYGAVDGTHFTLPDSRGRVDVGLDNMGGSDAARLDGSIANTLGLGGGEQYHTLLSTETPWIAVAHGAAEPGVGGDVTITQPWTATGHNNMQPFILVNKIIRT